MSGNVSLFGVIVGLSIWATVVMAQTGSDPYEGILNGPLTLNEISAADGELAGRGCKQVLCLAMTDISEAFDAIGHRQFPNSMAQLLPPDRQPDPDKVADAKLRRLLLSHPSRRPYYCAILTKIARHDSQADDVPVGLWDLELANRISTRQFDCAARVAEAFPRTPAADATIARAGEICREEHRRLCDRIAMPGPGAVSRTGPAPRSPR